MADNDWLRPNCRKSIYGNGMPVAHCTAMPIIHYILQVVLKVTFAPLPHKDKLTGNEVQA